MRRMIVLVTSVLVAVTVSGCVFTSTAKRWHGRKGPNEEPIYYTSATKIGFNLLIFVPFIGDLSIDGLVEDLTESVKEQEGDVVRIVQGATENYWYGWPPFTWIVTPVITTISADYEPTAEQLAKDAEELAESKGGRWYMPWTW